ncbi:MAG: alpha/beta hydrolase [Spirochaetales bacterium]|nr:alpha/beta hydrolase [Spirochaetales bacterium]
MNENSKTGKKFSLIGRWPLFLVLCLLVLILVPWLISILSLKEKPDTRIKSMLPGSFVNLSGREVYYEIAGPDDGPVVVFIHGYSSHSFIWEKNFYYFASRGFRVLRYDLFGRGYSSKPLVANDLPFFRHQLMELLDSLGNKKPLYIISLSMGALIAADFSAANPGLVAGLAYISPVIGNHLSVANTFMKIPVLGEYVMHVFGTSVIRRTYKNIFSKNDDSLDTLKAFLRPMNYRGYKEALQSSLRHILSMDPAAVYSQVAALGGESSVLIWGKNDKIVPYINHKLFMDIFPDIPFFTIANAGHCSPYEQPDEVNRILLQFLTHVQ